MSYEPSHRKPPPQERWPNATPGEGWPAYQQAGDDRAWESAAAYAGSRNGYGTANNGYGAANNGYGATNNGYGAADNGYGSTWGRATVGNGHGDAWGGARYSDPGQGYRTGGTGYAGDGYSREGYVGDGYSREGYAREGYADGFDGAADGYAPDGYADGYAGTEEYYETPNGWNGYTQPGHEFTAPAGYVAQEEYPALDPAASAVLVAPDTMGEWWRADQSQDGDQGPGHRGAAVGVTMGVLAAAVAIGVATLVAAFVRPQASPVSTVGGVFIDRIPATLRSHVMAHFGAHGQAVLLVGVVGLIAIVLGFMARRNVTVGVAGIAAFGLLGAFVAITRPESRASDVIPSAIGGLAGIVALLWLVRAAAPTATAQAAHSGGGRRRAR
jgi:hypothetical protein